LEGGGGGKDGDYTIQTGRRKRTVVYRYTRNERSDVKLMWEKRGLSYSSGRSVANLLASENFVGKIPFSRGEIREKKMLRYEFKKKRRVDSLRKGKGWVPGEVFI